MLVRTEGVVLKKLRHQDHDLILTVYTRLEGLTHLVKKGRKPPVQPLGLYEFVYNQKQGYDMYTVRDCTLSRVHLTLHDAPIKIMYGLYAAEVFASLIVEREPNPRLYDLLKNFLIRLDQNPAGLFGLTTRFLAQLTAHAGYALSHLTFNANTGRVGDDGDEAGIWMTRYFADPPPPEPPPHLRPKIWDAFTRFWEIHVPDFKSPRSRQVFNDFFQL